MKAKYTRKFMGKTADFIDKAERDHEKKHLKAYLRGDEEFQNGYEKNATGQIIRGRQGQMIPKMFPVQAKLIKID